MGSLWQNLLRLLSLAFGRGRSAVFRPAREDELGWIEKTLSDPNLFLRPRADIIDRIKAQQFYILDCGGAKVGCGAVWPIAPGVIQPDPGVPCVELGAIWLDEPFRGYGLERIMGEIGIAEAIAHDPKVKIYSGAIFNNKKSGRNIRWLGFADDPAAKHIWSTFCQTCRYREEAISLGLPCCVQPLSLPDYWVCDNLRALVNNPGRVTLSKTTGELLTVELKVRSSKSRRDLTTWICRNCRQHLPSWVARNCGQT